MKPETAESTTHAMCNIARDYAFVGSLPPHVSRVLDGPHDKLPPSVAAKIRRHLDHFRSELPQICSAAPLVERLRREGYENLTVPTPSELGKKVVFVTNSGFSLAEDPIFGAGAWSSWCGWFDAPVWIEKPADWPPGGSELIVVTGTLVNCRDVPVFRIEKDASGPIQPGLPVPDGMAPKISGGAISSWTFHGSIPEPPMAFRAVGQTSRANAN